MFSSKRTSAVVVVLALGGLVGRAGSPAARAQGPKTSARAAEFEAVVEKNVMIPMRDGVRLAADLYRPGRDGKAAPGRFPGPLDPHALQQGRCIAAKAATTPSAATWSSPTTCAAATGARGPGG